MTDREIGYAPHFDNVEPYPGAPKYFAQVVDLGDNFIASLNPASGVVEVTHLFTPNTPLEVVGFACKSDYPEDAAVERRAWANGYFMAWCFSTMEPHGEYGSIPVAQCREISRAELVNALHNFGHKDVK